MAQFASPLSSYAISPPHAANEHGAVAAGHALTAQSAAQILRVGGNAFDAAIAGLLMSCLCEPVLCAPAGGGFCMAHSAEKNQTRLYDFFSQTPRQQNADQDLDFRAVHADFGEATQEFHIGAASTATPGFFAGLAMLHKEYGSLPFGDLAAPAIKAAREGIEISPFQAFLFSVVAPILTASEASRALFAPDGHLLKAGAKFTNPALADLLQAYARAPMSFAQGGDFAAAITQQSQKFGGHLRHEDIEHYRVLSRAPLTWALADKAGGENELYLNPPPAASGTLIALSFALLQQRAQTGTPAAMPSPAELAQIMSHVNLARDDVLSQTAEPSAAHLLRFAQELLSAPKAYRGTTHISVIDAAGNAAAITTSNGEGNGHLIAEYGFMPNNMLGEEDLNPQGFNQWPLNTRLSSMMAPTLIKGKDGSFTALGSGGSNRIRTAILQLVLRILNGATSLQDAVNAPRLHVEKDGTVSFEDFFSPPHRADLLADFPQAHGWPEHNLFFGGVHIARRRANGHFECAGDPRREGAALIV